MLNAAVVWESPKRTFSICFFIILSSTPYMQATNLPLGSMLVFTAGGLLFDCQHVHWWTARGPTVVCWWPASGCHQRPWHCHWQPARGPLVACVWERTSVFINHLQHPSWNIVFPIWEQNTFCINELVIQIQKKKRNI